MARARCAPVPPSRRRRPRPPIVAAVTAAVLVTAMMTTACTFTPSFEPPAAAPASEPSRPTDEGVDPTTGSQDSDSGSSAGIETRQQDEGAAVRAVDLYWQRHFGEVSPQRYQSPQVAGGYRGENGPSCAGAPSVPGNAFYCPAGDFIAWDEALMAAGYRQIGDAWVYLIIAHEWGHAIQARLQRDQVSVAAELQADCMAGAALQGSVDDGLLELEPGDTRELVQTLVAVADDFPWSDSSSHGNAEQRVDAFNLGTSEGLDGCI